MNNLDHSKSSSDIKSELKVKMDLLKHKIFEFKKEIDKT
jgi:hypothetical protein